jgi:hypothetical protein
MRTIFSRVLFGAFSVLVGAWSIPAHADGISWPDVSTSTSVQAEGSKDAAIIVAIEDYVFLPDVTGATRNGNDWYQFLTEQRRVPVEKVQYLKGSAATAEAIARKAATAAADVEPGGTLWFVFIGHGAPAKDGTDGVLVGADATQTAEGLYARSIPQRWLEGELAKGRAAHKVMVVDACFSGRTGGGQAVVEGLQPVITTRMTAPSLVTVASAGASDEFADPLPGDARPAFSYLFLGALRGWGDSNGDGVVTLREAGAYARKALNILPIGRTQTPGIAGPDGDMPLSRGGKEPGPRLQDAVTAAPAGANVAPEKPRYVDYGGVLIGLPNDPPMPDGTFVDFVAVSGWKNVVGPNGKVVCTLPCSRWVKERSFGDVPPAGRDLVAAPLSDTEKKERYHLRIESDELDPRARRRLRLEVPEGGGRVRLQYASNQSARLVLLGVGAGVSTALGVGAGLSYSSEHADSAGESVLVGFGVTGGAFLVWIINMAILDGGPIREAVYTAAPGTFDPTRSASTARYLTASKAASKPRVSVSPFGIGGTW